MRACYSNNSIKIIIAYWVSIEMTPLWISYVIKNLFGVCHFKLYDEGRIYIYCLVNYRFYTFLCIRYSAHSFLTAILHMNQIESTNGQDSWSSWVPLPHGLETARVFRCQVLKEVVQRFLRWNDFFFFFTVGQDSIFSCHERKNNNGYVGTMDMRK